MINLILTMMALVAAPPPETNAPDPVDEFAGLSARDVVREGNRRLVEGEADEALVAYDRAAMLRPEAREIAFARGLANFDLRNFDEARTAFEQVAFEGTDALATDAQYAIGVSDHMEAIENTDNPELAISLLESAMRRYHRVLAEDPNHERALDANFKAASVWRRIKQMQEQQKQQSDDSDKDGEDQEDSDEDKDKKKSDEKKDGDEDEKQDGSDDKKSDEEESDEQKKDSDSSDKQEQKKSEQQSAEQKEQKVSQEQAQRQLREMMQALRERKKARQRQIIKMPVVPVEKDW